MYSVHVYAPECPCYVVLCTKLQTSNHYRYHGRTLNLQLIPIVQGGMIYSFIPPPEQ